MNAQEYINKLIERRKREEILKKMLELNSKDIPDGEKFIEFIRWVNSEENKARWFYPKGAMITPDEISRIIDNFDDEEGGENGQPATK